MSNRKWLIVALVLGAMLRFVGLFDSPPGPNVDEVSNGIDARCIWQTGHDRHGTPLPIYLKAFDDYREGLFVIVTSPLTEFMTSWKSLRLMAAMMGMFTIVATYGAVYRIIGPRPAVWSAFFLATDPQHVLWSRMGMEVILVPLGVALTWLSLSYFRARPVIGAMATVCSLLLTVYSGMMGKPAAAILFLASLFIPFGWFTAIRRFPVGILLAGILLGAGLIPAIGNVLSPEGTARLNQLQDAADKTGELMSPQLIRGDVLVANLSSFPQKRGNARLAVGIKDGACGVDMFDGRDGNATLRSLQTVALGTSRRSLIRCCPGRIH